MDVIFGRRRHNRHFNLDDNLLRCEGKSTQPKFEGMRCNNWGKPNEGKTYWCHIHRVQLVSQLIREDSGDH